MSVNFSIFVIYVCWLILSQFQCSCVPAIRCDVSDRARFQPLLSSVNVRRIGRTLAEAAHLASGKALGKTVRDLLRDEPCKILYENPEIVRRSISVS